MLIDREDSSVNDAQIKTFAALNSFRIDKESDVLYHLSGNYGNLDMLINDGWVSLIGKGAYQGLEEVAMGWEELQARLDTLRDRFAEQAGRLKMTV